MNAKIAKTIVVSIIAVVAVCFSSATIAEHRISEALLLVGPVSSAEDISLEMMGQVVILESSDAKDTVAEIESGSYIAVFGYISEKGQLTSTRIAVLDTQYVPGSSPVLVSGLLLTSLNKNGHVSFGELTIDVTPLLSTQTEIDSDKITVFAGLQPNPDGIMLADSATGFASYEDFSEHQNLFSEEFLHYCGGGDTLFSIDGGDKPDVNGGQRGSIGGGDRF